LKGDRPASRVGGHKKAAGGWPRNADGGSPNVDSLRLAARQGALHWIIEAETLDEV